jgi:hypothetical protein
MRRSSALLLSLLVSGLATGCDDKGSKREDPKAAAKPSDTKTPRDAKANTEGDAKATAGGDAKAEADANMGDDAKAADESAKADETGGEAGSETVDPPATAEEAAQQLGAWLSDPDSKPRPALLGDTAEIELLEYCGACDGKAKKKPKASKHTGADALEKKARELADAAPAGALSAEEQIECKDDCCAFVPDPDLGVGDNVVNLEKICLTLAADGKPTAFTRVEVSGSW